MSTVMLEKVLVVPTELFHELGHFQGFSPDVARYFEPLASSDQISYRPRGDMEEDPSFKQLIPYCLFRYTTPTGEVQVFDYLRGGGVGEARLRAKRSVGVGGHISIEDAEAVSHSGDVYREGMRRELDEEVSINTQYTESAVGMINDDETEVGKVHLGVVHLFDVESPSVEPREDDLTEAGFRPVADILAELDRYESWSQIVMRALFE
ncbi:phosphoesterase [Aeoliella sp.]|uniref:phosphoesterase n=1 Tax=Aeoliella sp. TaxID=2795800 RepID=UPI003CCB8E99